jgi:hypothetical protein
MTRSLRLPSALVGPSGSLARAAAAVALAALAVLAAGGPALAHSGEAEHSHGGMTGFEDADFLDPILWDGTSSVDCRVAGEGTIVWTLTGSEGVEYAELHIDEPVSSIVRRTGGPYVWISPLYPLDEIEADVDRIVGVITDDAVLLAVTCPEGGAGASADSDGEDGAGVLLPVSGGVLAGAALGLLVGSRRRGTSSAA